MTALDHPAGAHLIGAATTLAFELHHDHRRKSTAAELTIAPPYVAHLLGVAALVIESPIATAEHVAAALLHDAVEDQPERLAIDEQHWQLGRDAVEAQLADQLRPHLGSASKRVAELIMCATDDRTSPLSSAATAEQRAVDSQRRKVLYRERLEHETFDEALVSLADNVYNIRSIVVDLELHGADVWQRFNVGKQDKLVHYAEVTKLMIAKAPHDPLVRQLEQTWNQLVECASTT